MISQFQRDHCECATTRNLHFRPRKNFFEKAKIFPSTFVFDFRLSIARKSDSGKMLSIRSDNFVAKLSHRASVTRSHSAARSPAEDWLSMREPRDDISESIHACSIESIER